MRRKKHLELKGLLKRKKRGKMMRRGKSANNPEKKET